MIINDKLIELNDQKYLDCTKIKVKGYEKFYESYS